MSDVIRVDVHSPPDRVCLVTGIMVGNEQFAEINWEGGSFSVEIYPRQDGEPWRLGYVDLAHALELAKKRLEERYQDQGAD